MYSMLNDGDDGQQIERKSFNYHTAVMQSDTKLQPIFLPQS